MHSARARRLRRYLLAQDSRCVYCDTILTMDTSTLDHIIPHFKYQFEKPVNLVLSCRSCNQRKSIRLFKEFIQTCHWSTEKTNFYLTRYHDILATLIACEILHSFNFSDKTVNYTPIDLILLAKNNLQIEDEVDFSKYSLPEYLPNFQLEQLTTTINNKKYFQYIVGLFGFNKIFKQCRI